MKISEAKNGKVRYTESKVASGKTSLKKGGLERLNRNEPDFMEYLSEKDRRRWDRLSDSRKARIIRKAQQNARVREAMQAEGPENNRTAGSRTDSARRNTPAASRQTTATVAGQRSSGTINTEGTSRINNSSSAPLGTGRSTVSAAPSDGNRANSQGSSGLHVNRASGQSVSGSHVNSSPAGSGSFIGLAAAAAKKTASKVSKALKNKSEQLMGGEAGKNAETAEQATEEVKKVTNPIKKTVGAIFALLALIVGPFLFILLLIILLIVVIIFIVAWLISILIPAATQGHGDYTVSGMMPYYCQQDERWGSYPYDAGTIYSYGCGPTSMAMIMACLTGDFSIIPTTMAELGNQNIGVYGLSVNGTHSAPQNIAALYGIDGIEQMGGPSQNCCGASAYNLSYIQQKISEGCPILVSVTGSYCDVTTEGHYFVLYGQGENGVYIYDPATLGRIYQESIESGGTDWNRCLNSAKHIWIFPAPALRVEGDSNAEKIFNCLVSAGWSEASAAAAVGNFYQEAGGGGTADINPASYDSGSWGEAGGIAGFTDNGEAGNFTALKNFAAQQGKNWTDLQTQCEFLIYQMSHGTWWGAYYTPTCVEMNEQGYTVQHVSYEEFIRMTDVNEATKAFLCFYEDCGYAMAHYEDVRLPMALQAYAAWGS